MPTGFFILYTILQKNGGTDIKAMGQTEPHFLSDLMSDRKKKLELQIKNNSCQTLGPASKRVLPDLLFFRNFLIFTFNSIVLSVFVLLSIFRLIESILKYKNGFKSNLMYKEIFN
jgi:hypothetical protein